MNGEGCVWGCAQAQAREQAGLPVGEAWFDVCAEGSREAKAGAGDYSDLKHSDYSASLAEALYGSVAQALSFLCAVAPEVCGISVCDWLVCCAPRGMVHWQLHDS